MIDLLLITVRMYSDSGKDRRKSSYPQQSTDRHRAIIRHDVVDGKTNAILLGHDHEEDRSIDGSKTTKSRRKLSNPLVSDASLNKAQDHWRARIF